jgi:hypothetical protein
VFGVTGVDRPLIGGLRSVHVSLLGKEQAEVELGPGGNVRRAGVGGSAPRLPRNLGLFNRTRAA